MTVLECVAGIIEFEADSAASVLGSWIGAEHVQQTVRAEVARDARGARFVPCGDSVGTVDEGDRFLLDLGEQRKAVAMFSRSADNRDLPHLMLLHRSFALTDEATVVAVRAAISGMFRGCGLQRVCYFRHGAWPRLDEVPTMHRVRSLFLAARIDDIAARPVEGGAQRLALHTPDSMGFYEMYLGWYQAFWKLRPDLQPLVRVESHADLQELLEQGGLRLLTIDDHVCGLIAAQRHIEIGLSGWRMREKVIAPDHWGKGLAAPSNILFARALPREPHDALWGTIAPANASSLRSAQAVGRRVVGATFWIDL